MTLTTDYTRRVIDLVDELVNLHDERKKYPLTTDNDYLFMETLGHLQGFLHALKYADIPKEEKQA